LPDPVRSESSGITVLLLTGLPANITYTSNNKKAPQRGQMDDENDVDRGSPLSNVLFRSKA